MSITQPRGGMLTVQIEAWPDNPAEPRRWTETGQENGKMRHRVAGLQPRAIYQLKVNNQTTASLVADKAGRIEFASPPRTTGPQQFELGLNL